MENGLIDGRPYSDSTKRHYMWYMTGFLERYDKLTVNNLRTELGRIGVEHYGKKSDLYRASICFAKHLIHEGAMNADFLDELRKKKLKPRRHKPPKRLVANEEEVYKLLRACKNPLDRLIVVLLVSTGLRASEACGLTLNDVDMEKNLIVVREAKWGKTRRVGIGPGLKETLLAYLSKRAPVEPEEPLLVNGPGNSLDRHGLRKRLYKLGRRAGVNISPHALRRAFVTINVNNGVPLVHLQIACGHSDIRTTRSYCQTTEDEVVQAMQTSFTSFS